MVDVISEGYRARQAGTGSIDFVALRHAALIVGILYAVTVLCNLIQQFVMIDVAQEYGLRYAPAD